MCLMLHYCNRKCGSFRPCSAPSTQGRVGGETKILLFLLISDMLTSLLQNGYRFCNNHNGFEIAELDLQNRGPGEISGIKQSGWADLRMADIIKDIQLFKEIQNELEMMFSP